MKALGPQSQQHVGENFPSRLRPRFAIYEKSETGTPTDFLLQESH